MREAPAGSPRPPLDAHGGLWLPTGTDSSFRQNGLETHSEEHMQHALMYHGGFELNFGSLKPGIRTFHGSDDVEHTLPDWPEEADGLHVSYMEKPGKQFFAVRVAHEKRDVILKNEVRIDQTRHMGVGKRVEHTRAACRDARHGRVRRGARAAARGRARAS